MALADSNDRTGQTLRGYTLLEKVAKGSQADVYKARQDSTGTIVAVKILFPEYTHHAEFAKRFDGEVDSIQRINHHPCIVPMFEHWRGEEGAVLVLKWFEGGSLKDYLEAQGPQSIAYAGQLLHRIADILHAAHGVGVIHRDVKPENILLNDAREAHLGDFGIAKRSNANITSIGMMLGSPAYLSPEQLMSQPITPRTDGYALGVTLYETLLGEHPYIGLPGNQIMLRIVRQTLPPITSLRPDLPETLDEFFRTATAPEPSDRYPDLPTMAAAYHAATQPV